AQDAFCHCPVNTASSFRSVVVFERLFSGTKAPQAYGAIACAAIGKLRIHVIEHRQVLRLEAVYQ
ncbi:hypothetical protein BaRGS_00008222, partial [Batillaria attramentaria]